MASPPKKYSNDYCILLEEDKWSDSTRELSVASYESPPPTQKTQIPGMPVCNFSSWPTGFDPFVRNLSKRQFQAAKPDMAVVLKHLAPRLRAQCHVRVRSILCLRTIHLALRFVASSLGGVPTNREYQVHRQCWLCT